MENVVISDTSCLIVLDKIGQLDLLNPGNARLFVTPTIAQEFGKPLPGWLKIRAPLNQNLQFLLEENIDPGESSAIALTLEMPGCLLILDDLRARKMAKSMSLRVTGTLGVIAAAKRTA